MRRVEIDLIPYSCSVSLLVAIDHEVSSFLSQVVLHGFAVANEPLVEIGANHGADIQEQTTFLAVSADLLLQEDGSGVQLLKRQLYR